MNSATFKTFMAGCGLDSTSFAEFAGYNPRTVRRWCLTIDPPEHAVAALEELAYRIIEMQQVILDSADDTAERAGGDPGAVTLVRYRDAEEYARYQPEGDMPFEVHCALVDFIAMSLTAEEYVVEVHYPPLEHEGAA